MKRQRILNISQCITFLLLLIPSIVLAATDPGNPLNFRPPATDMSVVFLGNLFGIVDGILHGTSSQIMGAMFSVFNAAILSLGGILLMYTLIIGTLNTAHKGEALGEKWHTMWVPIRSAMAVALLIPKASGYCLMQIFVMWVVVQGVGAADKTWNAALDYLGRGGVIIQHSLQGVNGNDDKVDIAKKILNAQVCMHMLQEVLTQQRNSNLEQHVYEEGSAADPGPVPNMPNSVNIMQANTTASDAKTTPEVPMPNITSGKYAALNGVCGTLSWTPFTSDQVQTMANNLGLPKDSPLLEQATLARALGVNQMYLNMGGVAETIVRNYMDTNAVDQLPLGQVDPNNDKLWISPDKDKPALLQGTELKGAATDYYAIVLPTLKSLEDNIAADTKFIDQAKQEGWIMAGSYFFDLTQANRNAHTLISDDGSVSVNIKISTDSVQAIQKALEPLIGNLNPTYLTNAVLAVVNTVSYEKNAEKLVQTTGKTGVYKNFHITVPNIPEFKIPSIPDVGDVCHVSILGHGFDPCSGIINKIGTIFNGVTMSINVTISDFLVSKVLNPIIDFFNTIEHYLNDAGGNTFSTDPLVMLAAIGDLALSTAVILWLGGAVVLIPLGLIPGGPGDVGVTLALYCLPILTLTIGILVFWGMLLSYYVPLVPYIFFMFAALGWFIEVLQAMVAAPLLALGIAHPEGQHEVLGKAEPGVMLLLSVFLRPVLMIIGLIAGIMLSFVSVWMLDATFYHVFSGVRSLGSLTSWIFSWVMLLFVYVALAVVLVNKSMTPIFQLHTMIMQLFGYSSGAGVDVSSMAEEVKGGVSRVGEATGSTMGKLAEGARMPGKQAEGGLQVGQSGGAEGGGNPPQGGGNPPPVP